MLKILFCTAKNYALAARIVDRLRLTGLDASDISLLIRKENGVTDTQSANQQSEGITDDVVSNRLIANKLNWLENVIELTVPCSGVFVAAGPIASALTMDVCENAAGGLSERLLGLGLLKNEAKHYEVELDEGRCLISIHTESLTETNRAMEMLEDAGGEDISMSRQLAFTGSK